MNFKNYDFKRLLLIMGLFSLFAILAVLPAFADGHMKLPFDGNVHLSRFESIYEALANRSIPSDINFIGFKGGSTAYNMLISLDNRINICTTKVYNSKSTTRYYVRVFCY